MTAPTDPTTLDDAAETVPAQVAAEAPVDEQPSAPQTELTPVPPVVLTSESQGGGTISSIIGTIGFIGVMLFINDSTRPFLVRWWWVPVAVAVVVGAAWVFKPTRDWLAGRNANTRAAMVIFVVVPLLVTSVGSVVVLPTRYQLTALRVVLLMVVCLLPAAMWYLFIVTRKASLFNEFLANLNRLGLLVRGPGEDLLSRNRRVSSYLQRFEAVYGDLSEAIHQDVLENRFKQYNRAELGGSTALSTTTVPVLLSTVLVALGWMITLPPGEVLPVAGSGAPWVHAFEPTAEPVTLAFLGAYFFSLQMLFRRYVLKDLRGSAYVTVSMRIILAMIAVWVLTVAVEDLGTDPDRQLLVLGFAIGVFPLVIWQIVESIFKRIAGITLPSMRSNLPVSDLDGLTVWHEARLQEEDIENLPNMATADLVELLLNTRLSPERIIDWVDQAVLYTQLGRPAKGATNVRNVLRSRSIRTATSLLKAAAAADAQGRRAELEKDLADAGAPGLLRNLEATLPTNANLALVLHWRGLLHPADPATATATA